MKVLVASDGSENSMAAVEEAMRYSWPETAEFKVVSVVDNSLFTKADGILADQARSAVEKTVESVKKALREEAKVEGDVLYGSPKAEILEYADRWPSDLLIVGSRGLKGFKRALIGSVSHTLLLASRCSVRIGRRSVAASRDQMRILLALDKSEFADYVANVIAARQWADGTELICATAVPSLTQYMYQKQDSYQTEALEELRRDEFAQADGNLARISELLSSRLKHVRVSCEVLDGDPREAIVDRAHEWQADLIVTGCRGKNWFDRLIIGSVSEAIATWADCSVEVIKK